MTSVRNETVSPAIARGGARVVLVLMALAAAGAYLAFMHLPGTEDVTVFWIRWADLVSTHGLREGYRQAFTDYPPGIFILFKVAQATLAPTSPFLLVKGMIVWSVIAGTLVFAGWSRSLGWSVALAFALLLSSAALAYIDALYLAPLFASLWALHVRRIMLASFWFGVAIMLKWQPLIIAPFFVAHAMGFSFADAKKFREWGFSLGWILAGGAIPIVLCLLLVEPAILWRAFSLATSHPVLSLQGLNVNWLIELWFYVQQGGKHVYDVKVSAGVSGVMRILFYLSYTAVFAIYLLRRRSAAEFVWFSCVGFLMYFLVNIGVHENHLFVPMALSFSLVCTRHPLAQPAVCFLATMANLNLLLFYGIEGAMLLNGQNMLFASAVFALINTLFGVWCLTGILRLSGSDWRSARGAAGTASSSQTRTATPV